MTNTETTTITEINKNLDELKKQRVRVDKIDNVLRWIDESARGLASANEIKAQVEFRRKHDKADHRQYVTVIIVPPQIHKMMLVMAKDHWLGVILPLEAWLDARKIEHIESAKAD